MLNDERMGAIHDALAVLTWWISSQGLGLTFLGESMPVEWSGAGLHGGYIGRRHGWESAQRRRSGRGLASPGL